MTTRLRLASFDGGDVRSLSQLTIMRNIMHHLNWGRRRDGSEPLLPCDHFDLIGGSGTGGLIAIMLARLRMTVEEASDEFATIANVYKQINITPEERTQRLRNYLEDVLRRKELPVHTKLLDERPTQACACFVLSSLSINAGANIRLRSYLVQSQPASTITVVEAALATCVRPPNFASITHGLGYMQKEYAGVRLGANNPVQEVIAEAHSLFGGNSIVSCVLSVGCGHRGVITLPSNSNREDLFGAMRDMMEDCTEKAREIKRKLGKTGVYSRFSVKQGMQRELPFQDLDLSWILAQTEAYLEEHVEQLESFAKSCDTPSNTATLNQLMSGNIHSMIPINVDINDSDKDAVFDKLKPFDLECDMPFGGCMEGTREDIIRKIRHWASDSNAPNILWVKGHPGVGKSAIAISLVEILQESGQFGSSFFFQRERFNTKTPGALWRTIAYNLGRQYPTIKRQMMAALSANEALTTTSNISNLFKHLIQEPLINAEGFPAERSPVIVVDALDECWGINGQYSSVMDSLKRWSHLSKPFKIVVTSREDNDIEQLFSTIRHQSIEILTGEMVDRSSLSDVRRFFEDRLRLIVDQYHGILPQGWPGPQIVEELNRKAGGLFIWAKVILDFLMCGEPEEQLARIREGSGAGGIAELYSWILNTAFPQPSEKVIKAFCAIVGTMILAKDPLPTLSLKQLCSLEAPAIRHIFNGLRSVMETGDIPRFKHQYFVDFLVNPVHCPPPFLVDLKQQRRDLTMACLYAMKGNLRFNICDLKSSHIRNGDIPDLASRIDEHIAPHVLYSSRFWASHLSEIPFDSEVLNCIQDFMQSRFLFWLEIWRSHSDKNT